MESSNDITDYWFWEGPGNTRAQCRATDWGRTALGAAGGWPEGICSMVHFMLASPFPGALLCGPDFIKIYNDNFLKIIGARDLSGIGQPMADQAEDLPITTSICKRALAGETVTIADMHYPIFRNENWSDAWFTVVYSPVFTGRRQVRAVAVHLLETTESVVESKNRAQLEAFQRESERQLGAVVNQATAGIARCDGDGTLTFVNQRFCEMLGYQASEILGKRMQDFTHPDDRPRNLELFYRLARTGESFSVEKRYIRRDGAIVWVQNSVSALPDDRGKMKQFVAVNADITALKETETALRQNEQQYRELAIQLEARVHERTMQLESSVAELKKSNDDLQQFAYIASHDLQEPLRKIQQFGGLLKNQMSQAGLDSSHYLDRMITSTKRMSVLINDLLDFARVSTPSGQPGPVALGKVIKEVLTALEYAILKNKAHVQMDALPTITGDPSQLRQLFQNLLSNACKFHPQDVAPVVHIKSELVPTEVLPKSLKLSKAVRNYHKIDVSDNGIGFDEQHLERIFKMFQRLHGKGEFEGTGIGLAICEKIALAHGGAISASSKPGSGSTFSVYLPAH